MRILKIEIVVVILVALLSIGCAHNGDYNNSLPKESITNTTQKESSQQTPEHVISPGSPPLEIDGSSYYVPSGKEVHISFTFRNKGIEKLNFSPFPPELEIEESFGEVVHHFSPGNKEIELEPGEEIMYSYVWDQRNSRGDLVGPGTYNVVMKNVRVETPERSWEYSEKRNAWIDIEPQ
ncbi:MAG: hypothetical protein ACOCSC_02595 [Candidatus Hadarchaeota archaeon]